MRVALQLDSELQTAVATDYWNQSRRPLASALFILPLLLIYEGGILWLGPEAVRNGADVWLQQLLSCVGFSGFLLLPVITLSILLGWHHMTREPWRVSGSVLYAMAAESIVLALGLVVAARLQAMLLSIDMVSVSCQVSVNNLYGGWLGQLIRFFGAGIYEELLFRLMLVPVALATIGLMTRSKPAKFVGALIVTSLIFSLAHHIGPHGESFDFYAFTFRFLAGGFFAVLFVFRGFGIAAGTHALYDVLVGFPPA